MRLLFTLLSRLFPPAFRARFGSEIVEQALSEVRFARRRGGRLQGALGFIGTTADLVHGGLSERIRPTWVAKQPHNNEERGWGMMLGDWIQEIRVASRTLMRSPGFVLATVGTLTLALGANAGIFSVVDGVLIKPLPFDEPDRLVYLAASAPGSDFPEEFGVSAEFFVQYGEQADQLDELSTYNSFTATFRAGDRTERVSMSTPTPSLFPLLGVEPALGRVPTPEDEDVMVISHATWLSWFGEDPDVIGQAHFAMNGPKTIIGVMPREFGFPNDGTMLWIPRAMNTEDIQVGRFGIRLVGRMAPGADHESLANQLSTLASRLPERFGGSPAYSRFMEQHVPVVRSLEEQMLGSVAGALWVLMGSVAVVLLIACANVANLFSVRAESRARDLAVRRALGAGRRSLVRSQMAESVLIAGLAGVAALGLAALVVPVFVRATVDLLPRIDHVGLSATTMAFTAGATAFATLACGFVPALRASRPSLNRLRDGARGSTKRQRWGRAGLVVGQTALGLVLLVGSGLLLRSFVELRSVDPGYETEDIFTFQFAPDQADLTDGPTWARFHMDFVERLEALPGVQSVGIVENVPLDEGLRGVRYFTDQTAGDPDAGQLIRQTNAGADYFATMGIQVLQGRPFDDRDLVTPGSAVISRATAELLWPGEDPIGRRMQASQSEDWFTVIGVVEDVMQYDYRTAGQPMVYLPMVGPRPDAWRLTSPGYVVKTARAETIAPEIRELVREVAPSAPMYRTYTMEGLAARSMARLTFTMTTLAIAAGLALLLGAIGLYGILSYVVTERKQEIGVRMALGAEASRVRRMVVAQGARVVLGGVALGVIVALVGTRTLGSLLFGVEALDAGTFAVTSAFMLIVGLAASYLPARRASSVDPIQSMQTS